MMLRGQSLGVGRGKSSVGAFRERDNGSRNRAAAKGFDFKHRVVGRSVWNALLCRTSGKNRVDPRNDYSIPVPVGRESKLLPKSPCGDPMLEDDQSMWQFGKAFRSCATRSSLISVL